MCLCRTELVVAESIEEGGDRDSQFDADELFGILTPLGTAMCAGKGYLASGPHDLASAAQR